MASIYQRLEHAALTFDRAARRAGDAVAVLKAVRKAGPDQSRAYFAVGVTDEDIREVLLQLEDAVAALEEARARMVRTRDSALGNAESPSQPNAETGSR